MYKSFIFLFAIMISFSGICMGQNKKPIFIGLQPGITKEKFYTENEFDVNVIPIVIEFPVSRRVDLRFTSIANYHFGSDQGFSDLGLQLLTPVFFRKQEAIKLPSCGFYIAPLAGYGRNIMNNHSTWLIGLEPGYLFPTNRKFTLSIGLQIGGSFFDYDHEIDDGWTNHFGVKINLGFWM